jgi:uncharacterized protein
VKQRRLAVHLATLRQGENHFEFKLTPEELGFEPREVSENPSFKEIVGPIQASFDLVRSGQKLLLTGRVAFRARLACSFCGEDCESDYNEPLSAEFVSYEPARGVRGLDPDEAVSDRVAGDEVELIPPIHDAIHLAVPMAPSCRPDCKGLCAGCGADLNKGPCDCPAAS